MTADQLARDLLSGDTNSRVAAADTLATMGENALPATCALVESCADPALRDLCVGALEELGPPNLEALPKLAELVENTNETVVYWAATLLGRAGTHSAPYADQLSELTADNARPTYIRDRAAWALARIS